MERKNPWKTKSRKTVYENPWIELQHHEVITPAGTDGIYGKVHFKNVAIGILPIDNDGNTWLVGQYRYTLDQYSWEIPMGGGPLGDDLIKSAQRELKEETGISAETWTPLLEVHTSNSVTDEYGISYLAQGISYGEHEWEDTEQLEIKKLPVSEAIDMVLRGEITDSISVATLLKYKIEHLS